MDQFGFFQSCLQNLLFFFPLETNKTMLFSAALGEKHRPGASRCVQASNNNPESMATAQQS